MHIQLSLFDVDEFLLKSSHDYFTAIHFVKFVNHKLNNLTGIDNDNFYSRTVDKSKRCTKIGLDHLMTAPRFCSTYLGRILLISEHT
jgi:hypothetical protein